MSYCLLYMSIHTQRLVCVTVDAHDVPIVKTHKGHAFPPVKLRTSDPIHPGFIIIMVVFRWITRTAVATRIRWSGCRSTRIHTFFLAWRKMSTCRSKNMQIVNWMSQPRRTTFTAWGVRSIATSASRWSSHLPWICSVTNVAWRS